MNAGRCAYCGNEGPLTKEEVFAKFLARKAGFNTCVDRRAGAVRLRTPPVLRDVCRICNNERLGRLDTYASQLFKDYFLPPIASPVRLVFRYDFELLHRWLLKVFYNFARKVGHRTDVFEPHIPYILGDGSNPSSNSCVLVGVFEASEADLREAAAGMPPSYGPMLHTIGRVRFSNVRWVTGFFAFGYFASFASFCFEVIEFCKGTPRDIQREVVNQILAESRFFLVRPTDRELVISGSLRSSRDLHFDGERIQTGVIRFS